MTMAWKTTGEEIIAMLEDQLRMAELEIEELKGDRSKEKSKTLKDHQSEHESQQEKERTDIREEESIQLEERLLKKTGTKNI